MKTKYHVSIIGAGPGGLAAAESLLGHGLDIVLLDENTHIGGQLLRRTQNHQSNNSSAGFSPDRVKKEGFELVDKITQTRGEITIINRAQILGIMGDGRILVDTSNDCITHKESDARIFEIQAEYIILATGVRERYLPFKGWTLPGVISLGAAQVMMKSHGVLPGTRTIIGGSSPLMLVLVAEILKNKGDVPVLLDENGLQDKTRFIPYAQDHWPKLLEGAFYTAKMLHHTIPLLQNMRILEAQGGNHFETVIAAKTDSSGKIIAGTEKKYRGDTLAVGYGFVPNIELAVQAGCEVRYRKDKGGWIVKANEQLETSKPFIFAVGEITGVAGAKKSIIEGRLAALSILDKLDTAGSAMLGESVQHRINHLVNLDQKQQEYASFLGHFCELPTNVYKTISDDTIICRCENITMGQIRNAVELGYDTAASLKKATRSGMGRCQGRICSTVITEIIMALTGKPAEQSEVPKARIPVKNVHLGAFNQESGPYHVI